MKRVLSIMGWLSIFHCQLTIAQPSEDACSCNAALTFGVFSYRSERGDVDAQSYVNDFIQTLSYGEFKQLNNSSLGVRFSDMFRKFGLDASSTEDQYNQRKEELKSQSTSKQSYKSSREVLERFGDKNVLGAWSDCKSRCNQKGLSSWIQLRDAENLELYIRWDPPAGAKEPVVEKSVIRGAFVEMQGESSNKVFDDGYPIKVGETKRTIHRKDPTQPITINIAIEGYDVTEFVPKWIETASHCEGLPQSPIDRSEVNLASKNDRSVTYSIGPYPCAARVKLSAHGNAGGEDRGAMPIVRLIIKKDGIECGRKEIKAVGDINLSATCDEFLLPKNQTSTVKAEISDERATAREVQLISEFAPN